MSITQELQSFDLFKMCSPDFVASVAAIAEKQKVTKGTAILTEGQMNDRLLILSSGSAEVKVNGERVAKLSVPGDLMGEISVLAGRAATATILASGDVEYFAISASALDKSVKASGDFGYQLYRLFSGVLSEKIISTNEKARQFEIANRSLVDINRTLDEKVQERTDATFKRIVDVQSSLTTLNKSLSNSELQSSIDLLRPISDMFSSERLIRSRRVLVAEPDRKQQTIAKMALGGTGAQLETVSSAEEAIAALNSKESLANPPDLVFVSSTLSSLLKEVKAAAPRAKTVYMAGNELVSEIETLKACAPLLSNIVSRHSEDRNFTVKNMTTTVTKLISKDLFGFEKYMMWGVEAKSRPITKSTERAALIELMEEHLKSLGVRSKITDRAAAVAEELLMNAIYDAPTENGVHHYAHLPRTTAVDLKKHEQGEFRFACDGMLAAISVSDPFGAFRMATLLGYLERNANSKGESVQVEGKGGAGRGLHLIINSSDLVVFNVRADTKTEVIAFFNLDPNAKDEAPRQFHFFSE